MLASHYSFEFEKSFDMMEIRDRVAMVGHKFDSLPGLYLKAFLAAESSSTQASCYAPFYIWSDERAMTDFLLSDSFRAVASKFGRPSVTTWDTVALVHGKTTSEQPIVATQQLIDLPEDCDLTTIAAEELQHCAAQADTPGLHTIFSGIDVRSWRLLRVSLWCIPQPIISNHTQFELLHLSAPGLRHDDISRPD